MERYGREDTRRPERATENAYGTPTPAPVRVCVVCVDRAPVTCPHGEGIRYGFMAVDCHAASGETAVSTPPLGP